MTTPQKLALAIVVILSIAASAWFIFAGPDGPAPVRWDQIGDGE